MFRVIIYVFLILGFAAGFNNLHAEVLSREFEVLTGFGSAHLPIEVEKHKIIPLIGRALWEVKQGGYVGGDIFYASVLEPESEMEAGKFKTSGIVFSPMTIF